MNLLSKPIPLIKTSWVHNQAQQLQSHKRRRHKKTSKEETPQIQQARATDYVSIYPYIHMYIYT